MSNNGRTSPGLLATLKSFFKPKNLKKKAIKAKKKRYDDRLRERGYGGGTIIRTSHIASRRYQRMIKDGRTKV